MLFRNRHAKRRKALLHLRKRIRLLVRLRLQRLLLRGDFFQLRLHALQLPGKKTQPSLVAAASLQKPFQLPPAGIFRLRPGFQKPLYLLFFLRAAQDLVFCLAELRTDIFKLILRFGQLTLRIRKTLLPRRLRIREGLLLLLEALELIGP